MINVVRTLELIVIYTLVLGTMALVGCSDRVINTPFYDSRPEVTQVSITKPPVKVVYTGEITENSLVFTKGIMKELQRYPYRDYHFNPNQSLVTSMQATLSETEIDSNTNIRE